VKMGCLGQKLVAWRKSWWEAGGFRGDEKRELELGLYVCVSVLVARASHGQSSLGYFKGKTGTHSAPLRQLVGHTHTHLYIYI